jgi:hypothetical protein
MGQGGRVGEAYASACTHVTSGFSGEGADFKRFGEALQLLTWVQGTSVRVWAEDGGRLTMRVVGTKESAVQDKIRPALPSENYGLRKVLIEPKSATTPPPYPLTLLQQVYASISLSDKPGRCLSTSGFGSWDEMGREEMCILVSRFSAPVTSRY